MSTSVISTPFTLPIAGGGRDSATTSLEMAAKSNMFIKLHVKDGCNKGAEIPLIDLLTKKEGNTECEVSYSALRRFALATLFKHEKIPEYAQKNFQTCFTCSINGRQTLLRNDNDLTKMLEEASTDHLMDDNDNFVLDIHCTFVNTFKFGPKFVKGEMLRDSATAAADNAKKAMKTWLEKATTIFQKFVTDDDYVVVRKETKKDVDPVEWASRFVEFLFTERAPPQKRPKSTVRVNKKVVVVKREETPLESAEHMLDAAVDGFTMATDILAEVVLRHEEAFQTFFMARKEQTKACQTSSHSSLSVSSSKASLASVSPISTSDDEEDFNLNRGVEIEFDPESESELTADEWKIFFTSSTEEKNEEESGAVLLDIPCAQDVVSISSDEFMENDQSQIASISDDDSWAMLDDE